MINLTSMYEPDIMPLYRDDSGAPRSPSHLFSRPNVFPCEAKAIFSASPTSWSPQNMPSSREQISRRNSSLRIERAAVITMSSAIARLIRVKAASSITPAPGTAGRALLPWLAHAVPHSSDRSGASAVVHPLPCPLRAFVCPITRKANSRSSNRHGRR